MIAASWRDSQSWCLLVLSLCLGLYAYPWWIDLFSSWRWHRPVPGELCKTQIFWQMSAFSAFCSEKLILNSSPWPNPCFDTALSIHILHVHCGRAVGPEKRVQGTCPKLLMWSCSSPASISGNPFWTTSGRPGRFTPAKSLQQSWQGFDSE